MPYKDPEKRRAYARVCGERWRKANPERALDIARAWRERNPDKAKASTAAYRKANRDAWNATRRAWYASNPERGKRWAKEWREKNAARVTAFKRARKAQQRHAVPAWIDKSLVNDMYAEAKYQGLVVDHIVPLKSKVVCGLHWEGNLQLLTPKENMSKGNRFYG